MALTDLRSMSADALNSLEPHRMNNWTLEVPGLDDANGNSSSLVLGLQSFQLPNETSDLIEIYYLNERRQYAGRTIYDGGSLTLTDWIDQGTAEVIRKWRKLCYDPETGRVGIKTDYAKRGIINLYAPGSPGTLGSGSPIVTRKWELINLWPVSVAWGALDMQASDKIQIDVQFVYDKAKTPKGDSFGPTTLGSLAN
jgi:hypothetical protein